MKNFLPLLFVFCVVFVVVFFLKQQNTLVAFDKKDVDNLFSDDAVTIINPNFAFVLPSCFSENEIEGIDSRIWKYASSRISLTVEQGFYSKIPSIVKREENFKETVVTINGREAKMVSFIFKSNNFSSNDSSKAFIIYFDNINGKQSNLTFQFYFAEDQEDTVKQIISSIEIK